VLRRLLEDADLLPCFDILVFSDEAQVRKPAAAIFRRVLDETQIDPARAVHVGDDAVSDVGGARGAGMRAIHFVPDPSASPAEADGVLRRFGDLPHLVSRLPFPPEWRVLLIFDSELRGLAGPGETAAFDTLPDFPASETDELSRRVTSSALPALAAADFATFCEQVGALQAAMGAYFAPLQGGLYASPRVGAVLDWLRGEGVTGLGQSSWGPTGFAFAASQAEGLSLLSRLRAAFQHPGLSFELAQGRNEGAKIETSVDE